jgi:hypothetical protein
MAAFAQTAWELLNILQEHFPSKIRLRQQNLHILLPHLESEASLASEQLRRQISCLVSMKDDRQIQQKQRLGHFSTAYTEDEVADMASTLDFAERL